MRSLQYLVFIVVLVFTIFTPQLIWRTDLEQLERANAWLCNDPLLLVATCVVGVLLSVLFSVIASVVLPHYFRVTVGGIRLAFVGVLACGCGSVAIALLGLSGVYDAQPYCFLTIAALSQIAAGITGLLLTATRSTAYDGGRISWNRILARFQRRNTAHSNRSIGERVVIRLGMGIIAVGGLVPGVILSLAISDQALFSVPTFLSTTFGGPAYLWILGGCCFVLSTLGALLVLAMVVRAHPTVLGFASVSLAAMWLLGSSIGILAGQVIGIIPWAAGSVFWNVFALAELITSVSALRILRSRPLLG